MMTGADLDQMAWDNRRIFLQMELCANGILAPQDMTAVQAHVLLQILNHGEQGTSLTALHRVLGYSMAHLSTTLKSLRKRGYVRMESCTQDDRCKIIFATPQGEALREFLNGAVAAIRGRLYSSFSQSELQDMYRLQKKMLQNLSGISTKKAMGGMDT